MSDRVGAAAGARGRVLVCCAHGTASPDGRRVVDALVDAVRAARPHLQVLEAFVDVQEPAVADVVSNAVAAGAESVVVVPLLLSAGFHVHVDIARAVEPHPAAVAAGALGPDDRLADMLVDLLRTAGGRDGDAVVLAAAGSSDARAAADVRVVAAGLGRAWPGPVTVGFGSSATPTVPDAVAAARALTAARGPAGARVLVAAYLLAPGYFWTALQRAGADVVTAPLGALGPDGEPVVDDRLVQVVLDRFDATG